MTLGPTRATISDGSASSHNLAGSALEQSVVALYDRHFDFVWRSLRRLGVQPCDLEDAAQDVFVVVHQRIREFEPRASLKTWIFAIVIRIAKTYRRHGLRDRSRIAADETLLVCSRGTPEQAQANLQMAKQVQEILDQLDDDKRCVFVLAELEHMSAQQIAQILALPPNTVYSRLRLARAEFEEGVKRLRAKDHWKYR